MEMEKTMWNAYQVISRGEDKSFFVQIGVAFLNRDHSINVLLDALPKDGKIHLRLKNKVQNQQKEKGERV